MSDTPIPGGSGGDSAPGIKQTRLEARALVEGWPLSPAVRTTVMKRLASIVDPDAIHATENDDGDPVEFAPPKLREVIAAARALAATDIAAARILLDRERLELLRSSAETRARLTAAKLDLDKSRLEWAIEQAAPAEDDGDFVIDLSPPRDPPHTGDGPAA